MSLVLQACHAIAQRMETINSTLRDIRSGVQRVEQKLDVASAAVLGSSGAAVAVTAAPAVQTMQAVPPFLSGLLSTDALLDNVVFSARGGALDVPPVVSAEAAAQPRLDLPTVFANNALAPLEVGPVGPEEQGERTRMGDEATVLNMLQYEQVPMEVPVPMDGLLDPYMAMALPHSVLLQDAVQPGG